MNSDRDSAAPKILISVIIPTINESSRIASAIASAEHPNSEIIVVDGGSCDDTAAIAGKSGARVITAAGGRAYQQNRGAGAARGKIVLFLHADTLLPSNYAASVFTAFLDKTCMAGAFSFQTDSIHPLMRLIAMGVNLRSRYLKLPYGDQLVLNSCSPKPVHRGRHKKTVPHHIFSVFCQMCLLPFSWFSGRHSHIS